MKVWNWEGFWSYFTNLYLLEGALWTIGLTVSTLILGGMVGLLLAVMRLSKHKALSRAAEVYVWIFRGTPLLVQLIIIYTGLPQLGLVRFSVIEAAVIGLALNEAAYLSEILRGGILSVAKGQTEAARALGLKPYQIFRLVVLPQALRVIIPPLGNSVNGLLKTTSIASVISMEEVEVFMVVAIIYLVMTTCWDFVQRRIEAYYGRAYGAAADQQLARDDH
jgi:polar amino acid transport system permease protein